MMDFEEQPTRSEIVLTWLSRISFIVFLLTVGAAAGFYQGASFAINETDSRFDCVEKAN